MNRTDLALEIVTKRNDLDGVEVMNGVIEGFKYNRITLDSEGGRKISKPEGTYITLFCHDSDERENISKALVGLISPL
ncbi:MAG: hypothetical protein LBR74_01815, partial [Eubacterium sp.]|nr:hypothetical protein [Eubacterium sp.]